METREVLLKADKVSVVVSSSAGRGFLFGGEWPQKRTPSATLAGAFHQ
jgi:hypothetical protein